jgi:hypothetical protein
MGNAMHLFWQKNSLLLLHPPIPLILRSLQKFEREGKVAVLVVPDWKGQIWTPIVKRLIVNKVVLGNAEDTLVKGTLMKRKDLSLPPGNMAMYFLKNKSLISRDKRSTTRLRAHPARA